LLPEAIRSVLDQSLGELEVFVSDNASTDDTAAAVASFDDPRIHYIRNETNVGHLANMSRGFRLGTAPFVTILPDDDVMLPGNLERKVTLLEERAELGLAHSSAQLVHVGADDVVLLTNVKYTGGRADTIEPASAVLRKMLADSYWINFPTAVIRRDFVGDARFEPADGLADDLGVFLRLVRQMESIAYIAEPLVALRMHSQTVSVEAGFHEFHGFEFVPTFKAIANIKTVHERFFATYGDELDGLAELRSSSHRWIRRMLVLVAKWRSSNDRTLLTSLKLLLGAARVDPRVLLTPDARRFLAKGLVRRARRLGHRIIGRITEAKERIRDTSRSPDS
jgi:glycosyltransferase involved in cell wall biosynthesis